MTADHDQHRPYEELAVRHVMGALDEGEAAAFRSHLLDCQDCRNRVGELRSIASDLAVVERDERRERAAQRVETKRRTEAHDDDVAVPPPAATRGSRTVLVVGAALIVLLSVWNFVLRGQNDGLRAAVVAEQRSAAIVNFGEPWRETARAAGVEGVARSEQGALAVMVRNTDDDAPYEIRLYDERGAVLLTDRVVSHNQQVRWFRSQVPPGVATAEVGLTRTTGRTIVFRAVGSVVASDRASGGTGAATGPASGGDDPGTSAQ